ncbi:MAG: hypothetical protein [Caudoviricetes sp.]|nr:MAG: hypothetical protein [Caudoviricetes sp.]
MAGKTKVDLKFEMTNGTSQVVSFEVPNGKDGDSGSGGVVGFAHWRPAVAAGQKSFTKTETDIIMVCSVNSLIQPSPVWVDKGKTLEFAEGLQAGDDLYCLYVKG